MSIQTREHLEGKLPYDQEYRKMYKAIKAKMIELVHAAWEEGRFVVRIDEADCKEFLSTLEELKKKVTELVEAIVPSNRKMMRYILYKLVEEEHDSNVYGKLGEIAYREEALYSTEMEPVDW